MPARVSPTDPIHAKIDALFTEGRELPEILEEVARLGARLLMQAALEAEVTEFLGRERYQRAATSPDAAAGSRDGYRPVTVKTAAGPVTLERPKLRGTTAAFASRLFGKHVTKTNALETLVIASFVRGLSVRDVEATVAEALGDQAAISKSTVAETCKTIRDEYHAWARRPLDGITLDYLYLDASFFRMHPGSSAEPILAAWGITTGGKPVFVGLAPGSGESTDAWADFLTDLRERGLSCPLLAVCDGAKGLIAASSIMLSVNGPGASPSSRCSAVKSMLKPPGSLSDRQCRPYGSGALRQQVASPGPWRRSPDCVRAT